jgi:hypothetical protein
MTPHTSLVEMSVLVAGILAFAAGRAFRLWGVVVAPPFP